MEESNVQPVNSPVTVIDPPPPPPRVSAPRPAAMSCVEFKLK